MLHPTRSRRRRNMAAAAIAALMLIVTACGSDDDSESSSTEKVTFQLSWYKLGQFSGLFAADREGYFEEAGFDPTFTPGGANILAWQQVTSGRALLSDEDNTLLLQAIAKGEPLVAIGTIFQKSPFALMSPQDAPITSVEEFAGKTIAAPNSSFDQLTSLVKEAGVDPADVEFVPAGQDPTQLVTGQVDAYMGYATSQGAYLEEQGIDVNYLYLSDMGIPSYGNVIITTKENVEERREELVAFMTAAVKGYEYLADHGDDMAEYLVSDVNPSGGLDLESEKLTAEIQQPLMESPQGYLTLDVDRMQAIIDSLVEAGTLEVPLDAAEVVDTSILDAVYDGKTSLSD